jgi:hypothetical protein
MNEKIKLLAEQVDGVLIHKLNTATKQYTFLQRDLEKFAELIVRECLGQLFIGDPNEDFDKGIAWSAEQIKQHFGVEE